MPEIIKNNKPHLRPSFSLKNRLLRILWGVVYSLFFRFSPRPLHGWRCFLLHCFGATIGKNCHVYPRVKIWAPWNLVMKDYAGMADEVNCYSMGKITLGRRAVVSQGAHLCAGTHDYTHQNFPLYVRPIVVEDEAWICAESFVGPGVRIGSGAVIGARAVVMKSMPAWMVCAGNPCKPIKKRIIRKRGKER